MKAFMWAVALGITLAALTAPAVRAQQESPSPWTFTPQVGVYLGGDFQWFDSPAGEQTIGRPSAVGMARSPALGLGIERRLIQSFSSFSLRLIQSFSLRASVQGALFSGPEARVSAGTESCGTNCTRYLSAREELGSGGVLAGGVDLAVYAPRLGILEPYLFYGLGGSHAWYDSNDVPDGFSPAGPGSRPTRAGMGIRVGVAGTELDIEFTSYHSNAFDGWGFFGLGDKKADAFMSVGMRRRF